jgi:hypothetical protein
MPQLFVANVTTVLLESRQQVEECFRFTTAGGIVQEPTMRPGRQYIRQVCDVTIECYDFDAKRRRCTSFGSPRMANRERMLTT